ncbi:hypothetical protein Ciccas_010335 [Cichlidogyrus casuarinus]|uniref:Uncharacterized protein n=1 Tax=Cichlidogyrus casuarinus TaxID=1844966 RepID=A0ABD2PUR3_9PLAT
MKNLKQQVYLLELENNYIRENAIKTFQMQPALEEEIEKVTRILKELEKSNRGYELELIRKNGQIEILNDRINMLKKNLQETADERMKEKESANQDLASIRMDKERISRELANKDCQIEELRLQFGRTTANLQSTDSQYNMVKCQLEEQMSQNIELTKQLDDKKKELMRIHTKLTEMEIDFRQTLVKLSDSNQQKYTQEIHKLEMELKELGSQVESLLLERDQLVDENSRVQDQLTEHARDHDALKYELQQLKTINGELDFMHNKDSAQIEKLSTKEKQLLKTNHALRRALDEEREKNAKLSKQVKTSSVKNVEKKLVLRPPKVDGKSNVVLEAKMRSIQNALSNLKSINESYAHGRSSEIIVENSPPRVSDAEES